MKFQGVWLEVFFSSNLQKNIEGGGEFAPPSLLPATEGVKQICTRGGMIHCIAEYAILEKKFQLF